MLKWLLFFLFLTPVFFPQKVAARDFYTRYETVYEINEIGDATVSQSISLTNNQASVYATKYSVFLKGSIPENVTASDSIGDLPVFVTQNNPETEIVVNLRNEVVGLGKSQLFTLRYALPNLAVKNGQIWEISLPKSSKSGLVDETNTTITLPKFFGKIAYISPPPSSVKETIDYRTLNFTKAETGITAAFGEYQIFDFSIDYILKGNNKTTIQEIALPPDTSYQRVFYTQITPQPINVHPDPDGNWIASFKVAKDELLNIKTQGYINVYSTPQPFVLPATHPENYLGETQYWQVNDPQIKALAQKLGKPAEIYQYAKDTLRYDYSAVDKPNTRLGAKRALLANDQTDCQEYTDLFIALARSAGIPARELNGFGFTTNSKLRPLGLVKDILHAWPEYYDYTRKAWIQIDPTWGNTTKGQDYFDKLDNDHVVFAIHGKDPDFPKPAGDYKLENTEKHVQISVGKIKDFPSETIAVMWLMSPQSIPFLKNHGRIILKNSSPQALYNLDLDLTSSDLEIDPHLKNIEILPPYGQVDIDLPFRLKLANLFHSPHIQLTVKNQNFSYTVPVTTLIISSLLPPILLILLSVSSAGLILKKIRHD